MFGLFRKKKYRTGILPIVSGEANGIKVLFRNFPVRFWECEPDQRLVEPDFMTSLLDSIFAEIKDFDRFMKDSVKQSLTLNIKVNRFPNVIMEIQLKDIKKKRQFDSELPDAIINALEAENISS